MFIFNSKMKLTEVLTNLIDEAKPKKGIFDGLVIEDGGIKLWHFSNQKINGAIGINGKQGLQSKSEYMAWGRSRAFFYAAEDAIRFDTGVGSDYYYVCHIPVSKIYPVMENPNDYKVPSGSHQWESIYQQAVKDGYTAFIYNLGGNDEAPIVISFVPVKIDEAYKKAPGGGYMPMDKKLVDFPIGEYIENDGTKMYLMAKDGYPENIGNTYGSEKPRKQSYQANPAMYFDSIKLYPKYKDGEYAKSLKDYYA